MNRQGSVLLDQTPLQLDREGINKREEGKRVGGLFEGGDNFKYFIQEGDYSREAINRGTAIIRGITVINKLKRKTKLLLILLSEIISSLRFFFLPLEAFCYPLLFCLHKVVRYLEQRKAQSLFDTSHKGYLYLFC